jgi:hypothetical protein
MHRYTDILRSCIFVTSLIDLQTLSDYNFSHKIDARRLVTILLKLNVGLISESSVKHINLNHNHMFGPDREVKNIRSFSIFSLQKVILRQDKHVCCTSL